MNTKKSFLLVLAILVFCLMAYFAMATVRFVSPTPNLFANDTNTSGTITINLSVNDQIGLANITNVTIYWINASSISAYNLTLYNDTINDSVFNTSFNTALLADGVYNLTIRTHNATLLAGLNEPGFNNSWLITIDNTAPNVLDTAFVNSDSNGYGLLNGTDTTDEFYSMAAGNRILNVSVNVTDLLSGFKNLTFDFTNVCGVTNHITYNASTNYWWANCTVNITNVDNYFAKKNFTFTTCDYAGACRTLYRTITIYNFTVPAGRADQIEFNGTTNISTHTNLSQVNYQVYINVNGSVFTGAPWSGFKRAAIFNFTSVNLTRDGIGLKLANMINVITMQTSAPRTNGINRISVNTTHFSELNVTTNVTLYNLPFTSQPNITVDSDGAGNIVKVQSWVGYQTQGNLTFSVTGFSGYNITDNVKPIVLVHSPAQYNLTTGIPINLNFTFNGTGTEIFNSSISINLTGAGYVQNRSYTYSDLTCARPDGSSDFAVMLCNRSINISDGTYNLTIVVKDYGGAAGNINTTIFPGIRMDMNRPYVKFNAINNKTVNGSWSHTREFTLNITVNDGAINYWNVSIYNSSGDIINSNQTAESEITWNRLFNLTVPRDGNYTINLTAKDNSSLFNSTLFYQWIETVAPTASVTCSPSSVTVGSALTCTCSGTDNVNGSGISTYDFAGGSVTQSITPTTAGTFSSVICTAIDTAGNMHSTTGTYTVTSSSSSSGGGSGGSAGGVSTGAASNFEQKTWTSINAGETAIITTKNGEIGVTEISFKVDKTAWGVWAKVEKKDSLPSGTKAFSNKAYKYIEVTKSTALKDDNIKNAEIKFKVKKTWLTDNKLEKGSVVLYRYNADKWNELSTTVGQDDGTYVHYSASTPGFSYFVIGEKKGVAAPVAEKKAGEAPTTETTEEVTAPVEGETAGEEIQKASWAWIAWLILAIVVVVVIIGFFMKKKKKR